MTTSKAAHAPAPTSRHVALFPATKSKTSRARARPKRTMTREQRTRYEGVYVRHRNGCAANDSGRCSCRPGYIARIYDRAQRKQLVSPTQRTLEAARRWRSETARMLERGEVPTAASKLRLNEAVELFDQAMRDRKALTKRGTPYKESSRDDVIGALTVHVVPAHGAKRVDDLRRGDVQRLVDDLEGQSASRTRSVVYAIASLYRYLRARDLASVKPTMDVELPASDAKPRDRVATPAELRRLLDLLAAEPRTLPDIPAFAMAAYATSRAEEMRRVGWEDVDWDLAVILFGLDEEGRKTPAAQRAVPIVSELERILRAEWDRQGQPDEGLILRPRRDNAMISMKEINNRAREVWGWKRLPVPDGEGTKWQPVCDDHEHPILLHECRHTCASWLNAAGVNPKIASEWMGHATPVREAVAAAGSALITQLRYTHTLPKEHERARKQFDRWVERELRER